jgi:hypothetical protein
MLSNKMVFLYLTGEKASEGQGTEAEVVYSFPEGTSSEGFASSLVVDTQAWRRFFQQC